MARCATRRRRNLARDEEGKAQRAPGGGKRGKSQRIKDWWNRFQAFETTARGANEILSLMSTVGIYAMTFYLLRPRLTRLPISSIITTVDRRLAILGLADPNPTRQQFLAGAEWDFPDEGTMETLGVIPILLIGGSGGWTSFATGAGGAVAWHTLMSTQLFVTKVWQPQDIYDDMVSWNAMFRLPAPQGFTDAAIAASAAMPVNTPIIPAESWVARQRLIYGLKALGVASALYFMLNRLLPTRQPGT